MICENCRWEADLRNTPIGKDAGASAKYKGGHDACEGGTHCTCQHKEVGSHGYHRPA